MGKLMDLKKEGKILVTTRNDYFNSADEVNFHVLKNQVKVIPDKLTPILEAALEQSLLVEASDEQIKRQDEKNDKEQGVIEGKVKPDYGNTIEETEELKSAKEA